MIAVPQRGQNTAAHWTCLYPWEMGSGTIASTLSIYTGCQAGIQTAVISRPLLPVPVRAVGRGEKGYTVHILVLLKGWI